MDMPMDHPLLNQFLFYPRAVSPAEIPPFEHGSVHRFPSGGGEMISAYLYRPLPEEPTVLMFHGNGEVITDYVGEFAALFERIGLNFCVVDYRGYGLSEGSPSLGKILEDGRAAWDYFTAEAGIPAENIVLLGRSMGSIPAIEIASHTEDNFIGLIVESGIAGFDRWIERMEPLVRQAGMDFDGLKADLKQNLDHRAKIEKVSRPILILHTEADSIVPSWNAHDMYKWAGPQKAQMRIFDQGDHNSIFYYNGEEYLELVQRFVERARPD